MLCLALVYWLNSEYPLNTRNASEMSSGFDYTLLYEQFGQGVICCTTFCMNHETIKILTLVFSPDLQKCDVLSACSGGTGAVVKFKLGPHVVWVGKLHLITQKLADAEAGRLPQ